MAEGIRQAGGAAKEAQRGGRLQRYAALCVGRLARYQIGIKAILQYILLDVIPLKPKLVIGIVSLLNGLPDIPRHVQRSGAADERHVLPAAPAQRQCTKEGANDYQLAHAIWISVWP